MSVILRLQTPPDQLMHLTCAAAVAMVRAIEDAAMFTPMIKWTNDLVCGKHKLGGILKSVGAAMGAVLDVLAPGIHVDEDDIRHAAYRHHAFRAPRSCLLKRLTERRPPQLFRFL